MTERKTLSGTRRVIAFTPMETRREMVVDLAQIADRLGYEFLLVPEAWGHDSTILIAEIAKATERIRPMSAILSVWGRTPATIAMNTASLLGLSDGRYVLGLGVSTPQLAEGFHGVTYEKPAQQLGHVAQEVRNLLAGERATTSSAARPDARPLKLGLQVEHPPAIAIAGMGPLTKQVAATLGDYWIPVFIALSQIPAQIEELKRTRENAGLDRNGLQTLIGPTLVVDKDPDAARRSAAATIAWYIVAMGDNYSRLLTEQGFGREVQAVIDANPQPKPATCVIPSDADVLLDELAVVTTPDDTNDMLRPWDDVADVTVVGLPTGAPRTTLVELLEAASPM